MQTQKKTNPTLAYPDGVPGHIDKDELLNDLWNAYYGSQLTRQEKKECKELYNKTATEHNKEMGANRWSTIK